MDFSVLADHWIKLKEYKKRYKYQDLARELKTCGTAVKTALQSIRHQNWKKRLSRNGKVNKLLTNIPTSNITKLIEQIYTGAKLVSEGFL